MGPIGLSFMIYKVNTYINKHIQFIIEDENEEKFSNSLEIKMKNKDGIYELDALSNPALIKVQNKFHSCIAPETITSIFKWFLAGATTIFPEKLFEGGNRIPNCYILWK